ncbi:MAG: hypothetical protein ACYTFG_19770 [Planctomycetota bacterium]|jgi:hypothetical protein
MSLDRELEAVMVRMARSSNRDREQFLEQAVQLHRRYGSLDGDVALLLLGKRRILAQVRSWTKREADFMDTIIEPLSPLNLLCHMGNAVEHLDLNRFFKNPLREFQRGIVNLLRLVTIAHWTPCFRQDSPTAIFHARVAKLIGIPPSALGDNRGAFNVYSNTQRIKAPDKIVLPYQVVYPGLWPHAVIDARISDDPYESLLLRPEQVALALERNPGARVGMASFEDMVTEEGFRVTARRLMVVLERPADHMHIDLQLYPLPEGDED